MISSKYWEEQMSKYWGEQRLNIGEENSSDSNKCVSIRLDALKKCNSGKKTHCLPQRQCF